MGFELVEKIFRIFKFTATQLKIIAIIAISSIGVVYYVGVQVTEFKRDMHEVKENTVKNTEMIKDMKKEVDKIKETKSYDYEKFYNDMVEMNKTNNEFWNTKFNILIKYGNSNKQMLLDLIDMEDQKQKVIEENAKKDKTYKKDNLKIEVKQDNK